MWWFNLARALVIQSKGGNKGNHFYSVMEKNIGEKKN